MKRGMALATAFAVLLGIAVLPGPDEYGLVSETAHGASKTCRHGPLSRPRANCAPRPLPSTGNPYEDCVRRINQLRWKCQCLPPLARWKGGEKCANQHSKYDAKRGIHAGFNRGVCEPKGFAQNECPAWPSTTRIIDGCLQRMWDEGPGRRFSKHGHYLNMSSPRYKRVACGFAKASDGEVWSVQNFR